MAKRRSRTKGRGAVPELRPAPVPTAPPAATPTAVPAWMPLVLVALAVLAYANSFGGPFIIDDKTGIPENPNIRSLWPLSRAVAAPPDSTLERRPVVALSLALNHAVSGLEVWSYHAFNLAVHVLAALVLFGIVRRTLLGAALRGRHTAGEAAWLALAVALVWTLHPLQTEAVTYVIQRTELLMGLLLLLTLYCVIRGAAVPQPARWYAAAVAACAIGMGSKEIMVAAPLVVLAYDWVFLAGSLREILRRRAALYAGLAATWLILVTLVWTAPQSRSAGLGVGDISTLDYARTQCGVVLHYLRLCFWPQPLVIDYTGWPMARTTAAALPAAVVVLLLLAATAWALWRRLAVGFLGAWFFLILAPTSSFFPIITEVAAERRMYLSLAAVVALVLIGGHEALRRLRLPGRAWVEGGLLVGALAALAAGTVRRNQDYRTELGILQDLVAKRPENVRAHYNVGLLLDRSGQTPVAILEFAEAVRLNPRFGAAQLNLAVALAKQGRVDEAIERALAYLRINPNDVDAHVNLGVFLASQRRYDEAMSHYGEALRLDPNHANAHMNLGNALRDQGRLDEAASHYSEALRINPSDERAHYYLGVVLARQGRTEEAKRHLERALAINPRSQRAREALDGLRTGGGSGSPP